MKLKDTDYKLLWDTYQKDPNHEVFNSLATNARYTSQFATYLINNNLEIPERFLQSIANDAKWSYNFAEYLKAYQEVPEIIKQSSKEYKDDLFTENYFERIYDEVSL